MYFTMTPDLLTISLIKTTTVFKIYCGYGRLSATLLHRNENKKNQTQKGGMLPYLLTWVEGSEPGGSERTEMKKENHI